MSNPIRSIVSKGILTVTVTICVLLAGYVFFLRANRAPNLTHYAENTPSSYGQGSHGSKPVFVLPRVAETASVPWANGSNGAKNTLPAFGQTAVPRGQSRTGFSLPRSAEVASVPWATSPRDVRSTTVSTDTRGIQDTHELIEVAKASGDVQPDNIFGDRHAPPPPLEDQRVIEEKSITSEQDTVKIVTGFECSTPLEIEKISMTHFAVRITGDSTLKNWFMFSVEGAKGKTLRIDIMDAPLQKWWSLNPVYSDVISLDQLSSFETTPVEHPITTKAYNGPMLPDTSGQKWHYIPNVWIDHQHNGGVFTGTYCFVQTFTEQHSYIAMRCPYTPGYNDRLMMSLAKNPYATVVEIGHSLQGRSLQLVKIGGNTEADKARPCVLMYGREHGTEQDSSWSVEGSLRFLVSEEPAARQLREHFTFLLIPMLDPDGAFASIYANTSGTFSSRESSVDALAYSAWFEQWVNVGNRLDIAIDLHNIESAEGEHLFCVFSDPVRPKSSMRLHQFILEQFWLSGYAIRKAIGGAYFTTQLGGFVGYYYGALPMLYELNSQENHRHLALSETRKVGIQLVQACGSFLESPSGHDMCNQLDTQRVERQKRALAMVPFGTAIERAKHLAWTTLDAQRQRKAWNSERQP